MGGHKLRPVQSGRPLRLRSVRTRLSSTAAGKPCCPDSREDERLQKASAAVGERVSGFVSPQKLYFSVLFRAAHAAGREAVSRNHRAAVSNHKPGGAETRKLWMATVHHAADRTRWVKGGCSAKRADGGVDHGARMCVVP